MPSKNFRFFGIDKKSHCSSPERVLDAGKAPVLSVLYNFKYIAAFKCITIVTDAVLHLSQLAARGLKLEACSLGLDACRLKLESL